MKVYIAGPMTGIEDLNFPAFHAAAASLRAAGVEVVNPAEINADQTAGWQYCLRCDIAQLVFCDAVVMLPGWESSKGATLENHVAMTLGMYCLAWHWGTVAALKILEAAEPMQGHD